MTPGVLDGVGLDNVGAGLTKAATTFYVIFPVILMAVFALAAVLFIVWFLKFRYTVYVHSQRADGRVVTRKLRGGFFVNWRTKVERLKLLNFRNFGEMKIFIPPPPNRFVKREGRKDIIHLLRTSAREYIPIEIIKEDKYIGEVDLFTCADCNVQVLSEAVENKSICPNCAKPGTLKKSKALIERSDYQVHSELIKDWFEIASNEDERKYRIGNWIMEHQVLIIAITWGAVFLMSVMFIMGQVEKAIEMGAGAANACKNVGQTVTLGLLLPIKWLLRKK